MSKENVKAPGCRVPAAMVLTDPLPLPFGWASAALSGGRLIAVEWESGRDRLLAVLKERYPGAPSVEPDAVSPGVFLLAYSRGMILSPGEVAALPVAWDRLGGFPLSVIRETAKIPYGRTVTYGELAGRAGSPRAARAAGAALAGNPWPLVVPCHRVVGAGGRLVGFGKGLAAKEVLLRFEEERLAGFKGFSAAQ